MNKGVKFASNTEIKEKIEAVKSLTSDEKESLIDFHTTTTRLAERNPFFLKLLEQGHRKAEFERAFTSDRLDFLTEKRLEKQIKTLDMAREIQDKVAKESKISRDSLRHFIEYLARTDPKVQFLVNMDHTLNTDIENKDLIKEVLKLPNNKNRINPLKRRGEQRRRRFE